MRRMNRRRLVTEAVAVGAAVSAGTPASAESLPTLNAPAVISAQNAPVEIVFAHIWGTPPGEESDAKHPAEQVIDAFNEQQSDVRVVGRTDSTDYYELLQKVQAELAAGDPPALVITPWASINYAYEGLGIVALEDIAGEAEVAEVFGNLREEVIPLVQTDGKTVGLPYAFSCPVLYFNADVFAEAGVRPEEFFESWSSFSTMAPTLQETLDGNPVIGFSSRGWVAQSIIQCNGGEVMNDENRPAMDGPESVEAMRTIADLDAAGLYDRSAIAQIRPSFEGGSIAVYQGSIASLGGLTRSVDFDLQTAAFPVFEGKDRRMASGGSFIGIYAREEEQQQAAWEFLKFALSEEAFSIWMQTGYLNATRYELPMLEGQEAAYTQLEEGLTRETAWPTARGGELKVVWDSYVERIWANDIDTEEGCEAAADEINAIIDAQG